MTLVNCVFFAKKSVNENISVAGIVALWLFLNIQNIVFELFLNFQWPLARKFIHDKNCSEQCTIRFIPQSFILFSWENNKLVSWPILNSKILKSKPSKYRVSCWDSTLKHPLSNWSLIETCQKWAQDSKLCNKKINLIHLNAYESGLSSSKIARSFFRKPGIYVVFHLEKRKTDMIISRDATNEKKLNINLKQFLARNMERQIIFWKCKFKTWHIPRYSTLRSRWI